MTGQNKRVRTKKIAGLHPLLLLLLYLIIALLPLLLAYLQGLPPRPFADELSSALAMVGFAMLLLEFVLSGRFKIVSGRIGMDLTMRFHQLIARSLAVFILVHPFLYTLPMNAPMPWDPTRQLSLDLSGAPLFSGLLAWLLLPVLILWAIFYREFPYRYEIWRISHGFGAAAIALLGIQHATGVGRYSGHEWMTLFWACMVALALLTMLQIYVIGPALQLRHPYRVVSVNKVARKTWELVIEPEHGAAITFDAGQFVWLTLARSPFAITEHPFSISSCPAERPCLRFTIKEVGDFTNTIGRLPLGAPAYLDGPHGNLILNGKSGQGLVFIAGGVGLAPIMSMLRQLYVDHDPRPIKLIYGNRLAEQILYKKELETMQKVLNLDIEYVLSEPPPDWRHTVGQLNAATLGKFLQARERVSWLYMVCGPGPMIDHVEDSLGQIGVPVRQIVSEKFSHS